MPYIALRHDLYGITSLLDYREETAAPLCHLTQVLLRGPSTLTEAERELIAAHVSALNECTFCASAHSEAVCQLPGGRDMGLVPLQPEIDGLAISAKMKSLLRLAGRVQQNGNQVRASDVEDARSNGATDLEIHDTVLIAALFCLYNRYVDGLGTIAPDENAYYKTLGHRITTRGYEMPEDGYHALSIDH